MALIELQKNVGVYTNALQINDKLIFIDKVRSKYNYNVVNIDPDIAYKFQGNLYGLFVYMNVPADLFIETMYVNGYSNPVDFDGKKYTLEVPQNIPNIF